MKPFDRQMEGTESIFTIDVPRVERVAKSNRKGSGSSNPIDKTQQTSKVFIRRPREEGFAAAGTSKQAVAKTTGGTFPLAAITILRKRGQRVARSAVWWRRGELNPCPKIVNAPHLHV